MLTSPVSAHLHLTTVGTLRCPLIDQRCQDRLAFGLAQGAQTVRNGVEHDVRLDDVGGIRSGRALGHLAWLRACSVAATQPALRAMRRRSPNSPALRGCRIPHVGTGLGARKAADALDPGGPSTDMPGAIWVFQALCGGFGHLTKGAVQIDRPGIKYPPELRDRACA